MSHPHLSPSLLLSAVDDGYLAFDLRTEELHSINAIAALLVELCIAGRTLSEIEEDLRTSMPACDWEACRRWIEDARIAGWFEDEQVPDRQGPAAANLRDTSLRLREEDRVAAAYVCQHHATRLEPDHPGGWHALGELAHIMGRREEAREAYERYDSLCPGDPEIEHLLVSLRDAPAPPRASDRYLQSLYARFSSFYDDSMVGDLGYRGPALLGEAVTSVFGDRGGLEVLDLGCGTGLSAARLRSRARRLVGVDLSREMIDAARRRRSYDVLYVAEITEFLERPGHDSFDLVTACDTLIYFGDLHQVIGPVARRLRPGGSMVFTVERGETYPFELTDSGRYTHTAKHVTEVARAASLTVACIREAVLRYEYGSEVRGLVVALMSPTETQPSDPATAAEG